MEKDKRQSRLDRRPLTKGETKDKKTRKNTKLKKTRVSLIAILLILLVAIPVGLGIKNIIVTLKYKEYTEKMEQYGYNELYNNKQATATQKVTNAELIKVVVGAIINVRDISQVYYTSASTMSNDLKWYNYSLQIGVNNYITEQNLNDKANKVDALLLAVNTLENFKNIKLSATKLNMSESKLEDYTQEQQEMIAKAVALGLIENKNSGLNKRGMIKGELNKLVIEIAEKYATMHYNTTKSEVTVNLVTDKEKLPTNHKEYPYVVDSISKEVYEYDYKVRTQSSFKTPQETYKLIGYLYGQIDDVITRYYNKILNVNYETITEDTFLNSIQNDVVYKLSTKDVQEYVQHVKSNKIKLEGKATPLLPVIYNNGEQYVVRTKITFKVLSSDTNINLLFGDEMSKVKYNSKEITMYVDIPMGMTLNSKSLLVNINCLGKNLVKSTELMVVEE